MTLEFISKNKDGNYYIGYKVLVTRGIAGKNKKVEELLIVGIHKSKIKQYLEERGLDVNEIEF